MSFDIRLRAMCGDSCDRHPGHSIFSYRDERSALGVPKETSTSDVACLASPHAVFLAKSAWQSCPLGYFGLFARWRLRRRTPGPPPFSSMNSIRAQFEKLARLPFSCPALPLSVALWLIRPVAESLQLVTEDPFGVDANHRPYVKTPRTPAFGMADLVVSLKGVAGRRRLLVDYCIFCIDNTAS